MKIIQRFVIPAVLAVSASSLAATDSREIMAFKKSLLTSSQLNMIGEQQEEASKKAMSNSTQESDNVETIAACIISKIEDY